MAKAKASNYSGLNDPEFLGYAENAQKKWAEVQAKLAEAEALEQQLAAPDQAPATGYTPPRPGTSTLPGQGVPQSTGQQTQQNAQDQAAASKAKAELQQQLADVRRQVALLQGEAQTFETQRENRGATLKQSGANVQAKGAAAEAVQGENLLLRNITQELQGRISRNTSQAAEALAGVDTRTAAERGQAAARAGQAGYSAESGTVGAMAQASRERSAADQQAIEGYRQGYQNLLMGQSEAAAKAAESLTGTINTQTGDWETKSTAAVSDVTGNLLTNVRQIAGVEGFQGDVYDPRGQGDVYGVKASEAAVDSTLGTWSFASYMDTLNTLTAKSVNRSTWDRLLLEQAGTQTNPYNQFNTAISPLTPVAGASSNLLAAAAGADQLANVYTLSGTRTGGLL